MQNILDCAIVGGSAAGLSAAINLHQRGKTVRLVSSAASHLEKAEQVDNYLGLAGVSGKQMMRIFADHAAALGILAERARVSNIIPFGEKFALNLGTEIFEAKSVILATGAAKAKPIRGESELLGKGVSYCATCDGMLYRGKKVAVWGLSHESADEANFLASIGCTVVFIAPKRPAALEESIEFLPGAVRSVGGKGRIEWLEWADQRIATDAVFILRNAIAPDTLLAGLQTENGFITIDRSGATNIAGVYAAGDGTGAPFQVAKAVGEGLVAALSAAAYLDARK